jgi:hypothetical protein
MRLFAASFFAAPSDGAESESSRFLAQVTCASINVLLPGGFLPETFT